MCVGLSKREKRTLGAVARTLVPTGGSVPHGADDLGLVEALIDEVEGYPRRARRRMHLLFFGVEYFPVLNGRRPLSRMDAGAQHEALDAMAHHARSPLRRLVMSYLKQLVYAAYVSQPAVEDAVGYRYECAKPRDGDFEERAHH